MTSPTRFLQSTAPEIRDLLKRDEFIDLLTRTTLFRDIPVESLPLADLELIARWCGIRDLPPNTSLPLQPEFLHEIISGYVKIYDSGTAAGREGRRERIPRALLAWRVPGELLGDFRFALPKEAVSDDIETTDTCRLLKIPVATVHELAQRYPQIYFNIASNVAAKAYKSRIRAQILRLSDIEPKIARLFHELLKERKYDKEIYAAERLKVIKGTFYNADIGAFLGYGRRMITGGLQVLIKEKLLAHYKSKSSGRFVVCDEEKLRNYSKKRALRPRRSQSTLRHREKPPDAG